MLLCRHSLVKYLLCEIWFTKMICVRLKSQTFTDCVKCNLTCALIKKENKIFLIYMEIQMGSGAKSLEEGVPNI
jgi:hypothetical protein